MNNPECEKFRIPDPDNPLDPGRMYEMCTGCSHSSRQQPDRVAVNLWRAELGFDPLPEDVVCAEPQKMATVAVLPGVGTALATIFQSLQISSDWCYGCTGLANQMNALKIDDCVARRDEFIAQIRERAKNVSYTTWVTAATLAVATGLAFVLNPFDPIPGIFDEAVRKARKAQAGT